MASFLCFLKHFKISPTVCLANQMLSWVLQKPLQCNHLGRRSLYPWQSQLMLLQPFYFFFFLNKKNQTHAYSHLGQLDSDLQLRYWGGDIKQVCSTCFPSLETIHSRDQEREITFISSTVRCLQDSRDMRSWLVLRWHSQEVTQQEFSQRWTWALPGTQQKSKTEETSRVLSGSTSSAIAVFHTIQIYTISQKTTKSQNSLKNGKHLLTSRVIYTKCCSLQLPQAMKSW